MPGQLPQRCHRLPGEWASECSKLAVATNRGHSLSFRLLGLIALRSLTPYCPPYLLLLLLLLQRFLPGGRLASKSCEGRMFVWRLGDAQGGGGGTASSALEAIATWKVPGCSGGASWANRCQFGTTADGRYIAAVSGWVSGWADLEGGGGGLRPCCGMALLALLRNLPYFADPTIHPLLRLPALPPAHRATARATVTCGMQPAASASRTPAPSV